MAVPEALRPGASRRNHQPFLDLYELGRVIGTGGYAVVRECVRRASGERFAAKLMTVADAPAAGGRDIDLQARRRLPAPLLPCCAPLCAC